MSFSDKLQKNISLKNLTTFRVGGKAQYFFEAKNQEEVIEALQWAQQKRLLFFVLGGGSNVLINDKKYKGLVIKVQSSKFKVQSFENGFKVIEVEAGVSLGRLVGVANEEGLAGMEWAMGIPGTVGGAVCGNAGSFGQSMADIVESVKVIDTANFQFSIFNFQKNKCEFGYRDSIFKHNKNLIILSAKIKLPIGNKEEIKNKMKDFFILKKQTQPIEYYSAGSIFKNQELGIKKQELLEKFPELKKFQEKGFIPTAWFIEKAGLKTKQIGRAQVSQKHSNFIVNMGGARACDVKKLIDFVKKKIKKEFDIVLTEEVQLKNFKK